MNRNSWGLTDKLFEDRAESRMYSFRMFRGFNLISKAEKLTKEGNYNLALDYLSEASDYVPDESRLYIAYALTYKGKAEASDSIQEVHSNLVEAIDCFFIAKQAGAEEFKYNGKIFSIDGAITMMLQLYKIVENNAEVVEDNKKRRLFINGDYNC